MWHSHPTPLSKTLAIDTSIEPVSSKDGHYLGPQGRKQSSTKETSSDVSSYETDSYVGRGEPIRTAGLGVPNAEL